MRFIASLLLMMVLAGLPIHSQVKQCTVVVPVTVRAESGDAPAALTSANFSARVGNLKATAEPVTPVRPTPPRIAILLDSSGSMRTHWELARSVVANFLPMFDAADEIAFIPFSDKAAGAASLTKDRQAILQRVRDAPPPVGRTAIFDTIARSIKDVPLRPGDSILLVSDGGENISKLREAGMRDYLVLSGVRLFAVEIHDATFVSPEEANGPKLLSELEELTGGDSISITTADLHLVGHPPQLDQKSAKKLTADLQRLVATIDHPLLLRLSWPYPAGGSKPPRLHIEVVDGVGHKLKHVVARYPEKINGCSQPSSTPEASVPTKPD